EHMSAVEPPLKISLDADNSRALAGDWFAVRLHLERPAHLPDRVCLRNVTCSDNEVQVDGDLLHRDVKIAPGESYRLTLYLKVARPKAVAWGPLGVGRPGFGDLFPPPSQLVTFRPSLAREITVRVEPICSYRAATKVQLTLKHEGQTVFHNLRATLLPDEAL